MQQVIEDFFFHDKVTRLVWTLKIPNFDVENQLLIKIVSIETCLRSWNVTPYIQSYRNYGPLLCFVVVESLSFQTNDFIVSSNEVCTTSIFDITNDRQIGIRFDLIVIFDRYCKE